MPLAMLLLLLFSGPLEQPRAAAARTDDTPATLAAPAGAERAGLQNERRKKLEAIFICACPEENWTMTISHCPKRCADPQKSMVRRLLGEGKSDDEIIEAMIRLHGPRVLAAPRWRGFGKFTYLLPLVAVLVAVSIAGLVLYRWGREAHDKADRRDAAGSGVTGEELARVERELEGLD